MKKPARIKYEVDPHNRLVAIKSGRSTGVTGYRKVFDGEFRLDKDNSLLYHLKKSSTHTLPQQIKLSGRWKIGPNHQLDYILDKWNNQCEGNKLTISAEMVDVAGNQLTFSASTRDAKGNQRFYLLRILGTWQADQHNRLTFRIQRDKGLTDELTFTGIWEVDKKNQLIYSYTKRFLQRKETKRIVLSFKGYWQVWEKYHIVYVLNKELDSKFDFRVNLREAQKGYLKYEVGIGAAPKELTFYLFGSWRIDENLGVLFELNYRKKEFPLIIFGASCKLGKDKNLALQLKSADAEDLGIELKLSQNTFRDAGEAFLKALYRREEVALVAGIGFRW